MYFLHGAFAHPPLLRAVLECDIPNQTAQLTGARQVEADDWLGPRLVCDDAGEVSGQTVDLTPAQAERLSFFAQVCGATPRSMTLKQGAAATALFQQSPGEATSDPGWPQRWAAIAVRAAGEVMQSCGVRTPEALAASLPQILLRAASWVRAQAEQTPMEVRSGFGNTDITVKANRQPYLSYFAVSEQDVRFRRFNGMTSATVERAAFMMGDAVTVLPYDPARDRVLVVEQFRAGPLARGDRNPWSLEPIAGRIDPGETPEDAARREAVEETGLSLRALEPIGDYYPSPGAVSEYLYTYLGLADLPDEAARIGGLDSEAEDIRGVLLSFTALTGLLATGEAQNGPLILSALWLQANRTRLRNII